MAEIVPNAVELARMCRGRANLGPNRAHVGQHRRKLVELEQRSSNAGLVWPETDQVQGDADRSCPDVCQSHLGMDCAGAPSVFFSHAPPDHKCERGKPDDRNPPRRPPPPLKCAMH